MANPSGVTVQSSMGEDLEIVKFFETKRNKQVWYHFDLRLMSNDSKKTRCHIVKSFIDMMQTRR